MVDQTQAFNDAGPGYEPRDRKHRRGAFMDALQEDLPQVEGGALGELDGVRVPSAALLICGLGWGVFSARRLKTI